CVPTGVPTIVLQQFPETKRVVCFHLPQIPMLWHVPWKSDRREFHLEWQLEVSTNARNSLLTNGFSTIFEKVPLVSSYILGSICHKTLQPQWHSNPRVGCFQRVPFRASL